MSMNLRITRNPTPTKRQRAKEAYRTRASKPAVKSYYLICRVPRGLLEAFSATARQLGRKPAEVLRNHAAKYAGWTP